MITTPIQINCKQIDSIEYRLSESTLVGFYGVACARGRRQRSNVKTCQVGDNCKRRILDYSTPNYGSNLNYQ